MEKCVIEKCNCERRKLITVSKFNSLLIDSRSVKLSGAKDNRETGKCGHFSIHGYVAEIRKRDRKICWPFLMHDDHNNLEEYCNMLPPLCVTEFKRWDCQNCLRKIDSASAVAGKKENDAKAMNPMGEDIHKSKGSDDITKDYVNQITQKTSIEEKRFEPCQVGEINTKESSKFTIDLETNKHGCNLLTCETPISSKAVFHDKDNLEMVNVKPKGNGFVEMISQGYGKREGAGAELDYEIPTCISDSISEFNHSDILGFSGRNSGKMKEQHEIGRTDYGIPLEVSINIQIDDASNAVTSHIDELHLMGPGESDYESSENIENLIKNKSSHQNNPIQNGTSNGISHRKKVRKIRLLTDIIKSEVYGLPEKAHDYNENAESASDASAGLGPHLKNHVAVWENQRKPVMGKQRDKTFEVEDGVASLMHFRKGLPEKIKNHEENTEAKYTDAEVVNFKSPDISVGKVQQNSLVCNEATKRKSRKIIDGQRQIKLPRDEDRRSSLNPSQEGMLGKVQSFGRDVETGYVDTAINYSLQDEFPGSGPHQDLRLGTHRKATASKKRRPRVEDEESSLIHWTKDSVGISNYETTADLQGYQKITKKQRARTNKICEEAALDDIPMDIVELMAKNQHERRLWNAEDAIESRYNFLEATTNLKEGNNIKDFTEVNENKLSGFLHDNNNFMQNPLSNDPGSGKFTTGRNIGNAKKRLNGYHCHINSGYTTHFNINKPGQSATSKGSGGFSQCQEKPSSKGQFGVTDSSRNSDTQNCRWNRNLVGSKWSLTCMQYLEAYRIHQNVSRQNSCGKARHGESLMLSNNPQIADGLHHKRNTKIISHGNQSLNHTNPNIDPQLQKQNQKDDSNMNNSTLSTYDVACTEEGNEYQSQMIDPLDLYTNDTISAMNLLRLMDPRLCSNTPIKVFMDDHQSKFLREPCYSQNHQDKDLFGLEHGVSETSKVSIHPTSSEYFDQNQHMGNLRELSPQRRKIASPGSSSQKGTRADSNIVSRPIGLPTKGKLYRKNRAKQKRKSSSERSFSWGKNLGKRHESVPVHHLQKRFSCTSDYTPLSKNSWKRGHSVADVELDIHKKDDMFDPVKSNQNTEICTVNRNPAEFSIPELENMFMIGSDDLKHRNMFPSRDRPRPFNPEGHKRQRMMKLSAIQGYGEK